RGDDVESPPVHRERGFESSLPPDGCIDARSVDLDAVLPRVALIYLEPVRLVFVTKLDPATCFFPDPRPPAHRCGEEMCLLLRQIGRVGFDRREHQRYVAVMLMNSQGFEKKALVRSSSPNDDQGLAECAFEARQCFRTAVPEHGDIGYGR